MHSFSYSVRRVLSAAALSGCLLLPAVPGFCKEDAPINIEADHMVSQEEKNVVVFTGNVDASQGGLAIRTDEMTVYYEQNEQKNAPKKGVEKPKSKSSKMKKMICIGNVQVTQGDWLGTGERMDYFADERKAILSGNAKAWQGQNMVSGKTITYYLDEKRSVVEQDTSKQGRVKAVIQQK